MNQLQHVEEFQKYLTDYKLSKRAAMSIADLTLVLLVAPSSSGRNTIIRELLKTGEYYFIISDTTREPRSNDGVMEQTGREYWFRSEEDALQDIKNGEFLEAAIIHNQQVSGISIRELNRAQHAKKIAIADVEVVGAGNIQAAKSNTIIIFVVPPSFDAWIKRLNNRGTLPEDEVRRRLESAVHEFEAALEHDYYRFVINDQLDDAVTKIFEITKLGQTNAIDQVGGRALVETLLKATRAYLNAA